MRRPLPWFVDQTSGHHEIREGQRYVNSRMCLTTSRCHRRRYFGGRVNMFFADLLNRQIYVSSRLDQISQTLHAHFLKAEMTSMPSKKRLLGFGRKHVPIVYYASRGRWDKEDIQKSERSPVYRFGKGRWPKRSRSRSTPICFSSLIEEMDSSTVDLMQFLRVMSILKT